MEDKHIVTKAPETAVFEIRPEEMLRFTDGPYDQSSCYAVRLVEADAFPSGKAHEESKLLSIQCAGWYNTEQGKSGNEKRWGWVHLGPMAKEMIGHGLVELNVEVGKWYFMYVCGGVGHRPKNHFDVAE